MPLLSVPSHPPVGPLAGAANPLGQKKAYAYDALNRLTRKEVRSPSGGRSVTDYSYDAVGNLLKAANGEGAVSYTYDALNRPVETVQSFGGQAYTIGYAYDAVGNRTAMRTPWGGYTYTYDALNRLTGLVNPQGVTVNFKYDAAGRRVKKIVFKNAPALLAETDYTYDAAGQLLSITNKAGGRVVAFNTYEYDLAGNRVLKKDQDGVTRYGYDKSNRLITVEPVPAYIPGEEAFIYDKNGNRRFDKGAKDYKYDAANRLQENTVYAYTHDVNGNLTGRTHKAGGTAVTYAYNLEQQLAEVITPEHRLQYKYDPLGRRISRTVDGIATNYVYDGQDIIADMDAAGNLINTYTNGPGIDEPLIMSKPDGRNYYYHADAMGSITAITDDNAKVVETYKYKAYGCPAIKDAQGQPLDRSSIGNLRLFTAREYEPETGDYNYRARYYDPARGAFTQEDPIGFLSGENNLYSYVLNNPTRWNDFSGYKRGDWWDIRSYLPDLDAATQIAEETKIQAIQQGVPGKHNGMADAWRHARWNQRMVEEIGWGTALIAGYGHELDGLRKGQPISEFLMDLHNNRIGREIAFSGMTPLEIKDQLRTISPKCAGKGVY